MGDTHAGTKQITQLLDWQFMTSWPDAGRSVWVLNSAQVFSLVFISKALLGNLFIQNQETLPRSQSQL